MVHFKILYIDNLNSPLIKVLNEEKEFIENEIRNLCGNYISLVDTILLKTSNDVIYIIIIK